MLKCCGCQTNFILSLGGSFLFSKNYLPTPSLTGGLVMPIRRTTKKHSPLLRECFYHFILIVIIYCLAATPDLCRVFLISFIVKTLLCNNAPTRAPVTFVFVNKSTKCCIFPAPPKTVTSTSTTSAKA